MNRKTSLPSAVCWPRLDYLLGPPSFTLLATHGITISEDKEATVPLRLRIDHHLSVLGNVPVYVDEQTVEVFPPDNPTGIRFRPADVLDAFPDILRPSYKGSPTDRDIARAIAYQALKHAESGLFRKTLRSTVCIATKRTPRTSCGPDPQLSVWQKLSMDGSRVRIVQTRPHIVEDIPWETVEAKMEEALNEVREHFSDAGVIGEARILGPSDDTSDMPLAFPTLLPYLNEDGSMQAMLRPLPDKGWSFSTDIPYDGRSAAFYILADVERRSLPTNLARIFDFALARTKKIL